MYRKAGGQFISEQKIMQGIAFLQDLAVVIIVAGAVTILFHRFRQPVVLGYILAGFIIGPHSPPFPLVHDQDSIQTLAELGVTFLIFGLGMQFSVRTLKQVGTTAVTASVLEVLFMLFLGYLIGTAFGWSRMDSIFLGAMLSITSTTIIVKTLGDLKLLKAPFAQRIFGIQVIEDSLGMTLIVLLTGLAATGTLHFSDGVTAILGILIFVSVVLIVGFILVPRLIRYVAHFQSNEMLLITVLGLCFGVTLLAVKLEHSMVLGAFLIGTIIGETREIGKIKILMEPVRDLFSAIFFVTIGMMINPELIAQYTVPILVISLAVVLGKVGIFSLGTFIAGNDARTSLRVGTAMVPIGELSFIIATLGLTLGVTSEFLYAIAVSISAITMPLTPYLVRHADSLISLLERHCPPRLVRSARLYHRWTCRLAARKTSLSARLARKWTLQLSLNALLISAIFLTAAFLVHKVPIRISGVTLDEYTLRALYWMAAALISLPVYVAMIRKIQAIGMLLGEISAASLPAGTRKTNVQNAVSAAVLSVGIMIIALLTLALSGAFLPPWHKMVVLVALLLLTGWISWQKLIRIYSRAQGALHVTFAPLEQGQESDAPANTRALTTALRNAALDHVMIGPDSPANGKLVSELLLRTQTGATIVAIERGDQSIINPSASEEIKAGDTLIIMGSEEQIRTGRAFLQKPDIV